jgi:hypothetical protein
VRGQAERLQKLRILLVLALMLAAAALGQIVRFDQRVFAEVGHGMEVEVEGLTGQEGFSDQLTVPHSASRRETFGGVIHEEYSDSKLFLGMALSPQNSARPSSATFRATRVREGSYAPIASRLAAVASLKLSAGFNSP